VPLVSWSEQASKSSPHAKLPAYENPLSKLPTSHLSLIMYQLTKFCFHIGKLYVWNIIMHAGKCLSIDGWWFRDDFVLATSRCLYELSIWGFARESDTVYGILLYDWWHSIAANCDSHQHTCIISQWFVLRRKQRNRKHNDWSSLTVRCSLPWICKILSQDEQIF
jgi:hypothetical protein